MPDNTMPDDVRRKVLATAPRDGLTAIQAIAAGWMTHEQAMDDMARLYYWDIHREDDADADMQAARQRIARSRAIAECVQHQRDFYSLQGVAVSEADMLDTATEIVDDSFGKF